MEEKIITKGYTFDWIAGTTDVIDYNIFGDVAPGSYEIMDKLIKLLLGDKRYNEYTLDTVAFNGYKRTLTVRDGVSILLFGPKSNRQRYTTQILIKGHGCSEFARTNKFFELIEFLLDLDFCFKPTRVDLAIDDFYCQEMNYEYFYKKIKAEEFTSVWRSHPKEIHPCKKDFGTDGLTIQFGSSQSKIDLVVYDKQAERKVKTDYLSDTPFWVRYEMRFKDEKAAVLLQTYYAAISNKGLDYFNQFVISTLSGILELKVPNENNDRKRTWDIDPVWEKFIGSFDDIELKATKITRPKIQKLKLYLEKSVFKCLAKIYLSIYGAPNDLEFMRLWIRNNIALVMETVTPAELVDVNVQRDFNGLEELNMKELPNIASKLFESNERLDDILDQWNNTDESRSKSD